MPRIPVGIGKKTNSRNKKSVSNKVSFENFKPDNLEREGKVSSVSLKLKDIECFEKNVRLKYDKEDMESLKRSIQNRDDIGNIDVYHITKGDRYIISDGHRTYRAYSELYGKDHKVEVVVRREVPDLTPEVELNLMEIGFVTSNTKKNLGFYEEAYSIKKYLSQLDGIYPDKAPHKVSQIIVYEALGLNKSKAMTYNKLLQKFSLEELSTFEDEDVSYKLLLEIAKIKDQGELEDVVHVIKEGKLETTGDLKVYNEVKEEINESEETEDGGVNQEEKRKKVIEEMDKKKTEKKDGANEREEYKSVNSIKTASKKFYKELLNLNVDSLTSGEKDILLESIENIRRIIKDKKL